MVTDRQKLGAAAFFASLLVLLVVYAVTQDALSFAESAKRIQGGRFTPAAKTAYAILLIMLVVPIGYIAGRLLEI